MKGQKKVRKVMKEFKKGKLNIGGSKKKVKNRKQAIAIALSEAGISKKNRRFTNLWILVVASIYGIKGTQIFRNGGKK